MSNLNLNKLAWEVINTVDFGRIWKKLVRSESYFAVFLVLEKIK